jgi:Leucine-rich repeat (LRR) protein
MQELKIEEARKREDKEAVFALVASSSIEGIDEFPHLVSLELTGNHEIKDFSFLEKLPKLQKLYLSDTGITEIPSEVAKLGELTTLFLGKNAIKDFSLLASLPKLVDLGLEEMSLRKIPDEVLAISDLRILGLYGNSIASIASLKKLPKLEELYVASNNLKKIPKELKKLSALRKLDIMHNYKLSDWSVVGELAQLEELMMTNAHDIERLPAEIFELPNLRSLTIRIHWNASSDPLEGLNRIDKLEHLEQLSLHSKGITRLPDGFASLKKLEKLNLKDNENLVDISNLRDLPLLKELNLASTGITEIGESFSSLKSLESLYISGVKKLAAIPGLKDLPALSEMTLYSKLKALPETMASLTGLKKLNLSTDGASETDFLAHLKELEELYIADCVFDALPSSLKKLQKLTVFRKKGEDDYLQYFTELEELAVTQPSFQLPKLPKLKKLSVGRISNSLDLSQLDSMPELEELSIHRSDSITKIPSEVAGARGLRRVTFEFLDELVDVSALGGLAGLEEIEMRYCKSLEALPSELAPLVGLAKVELYGLDKLKDLGVLAKLQNLADLDLERLESLAELPELDQLQKLRRVSLDDLEALKDISVLERVPNLQEFECDDCDGLSRKKIAAVESAIADRAGGGSDLTMSYRQFIEGGHYKSLDGKEDSKQTYGFPLWIGDATTIRDAMDDFSWLDDYRDYDDERGAILKNDSALKPLAILDLGFEGCDTEYIDAYCEEIFLVDTASARNPVFIWGHDGGPTQIHDSFDDFLANLRDFELE